MNAETEVNLEEAPSRYVVGIDLGTTNSAVAFVDSEKKKWKIENFPIHQLVAPNQVESRDSLPSFHYQAADQEFGDTLEALKLPWSSKPGASIVGVLARDHGAQVPSRMIASAKSWLCHTGVDRTQDLLPWQGADDIERLSPVEVSSRYLSHIRQAWDNKHAHHKLADQDVVLTLPASFDEVARELTVAAAARAGLQRVTLIEEPQAAFYNWINQHRDNWQSLVKARQKILVCDVGGGTSDFTLILVRPGGGDTQAGSEAEVQFHRVAVGDHLILGGDNLDLALAQHLETRLAGEGKRLPPRRWDALWRQCRQVKETLLGANAPDALSVSVSGAGSKLIGGAMQCEVTREEVESLLVEGFFPITQLDERPKKQASGFQEFGLPFAADAAVTRYLGEFLRTHQETGVDWDQSQGASASARPDIVLFNGGVFSSPVIQQRTIDCLADWFSDGEDTWAPQVLENDRLDLAVARGAAYFGMVRRGEGVKINSGLARTYYVGVQSDRPSALCLVPAGAEPGADIVLDEQTFQLQVATPVEFPLFVSSTRLTDVPGQLVEVDPEQLRPLAPIRTVLKTRSRDHEPLKVQLSAHITEIGTLELGCQERDGERRWRLQFDVRSATQTDVAQHEGVGEQAGFFDESLWQGCEQVLIGAFGGAGQNIGGAGQNIGGAGQNIGGAGQNIGGAGQNIGGAGQNIGGAGQNIGGAGQNIGGAGQNIGGAGQNIKPSKVVKRLEEELQERRDHWAPTLLRRIWEALIDLEEGRRKSAAHEARWLNLLGFSLRPGYGLAVDDWRVAETWRTVQGKLAHGASSVRTEVWIMWRRVAGGLRANQQQALADPLLGMVRQLHKRLHRGAGKKSGIDLTSHEASEIWRLLGSLEHLPLRTKMELGDLMCDLLPRRQVAPIRSGMLWALARIGARQPVYGLLNDVVPRERVEKWLAILLDLHGDEQVDQFALMQLARRSEDRYRDVDESLRGKVLERLGELSAPENLRRLVAEGGQLDDEQEKQVFGESLPHGLHIL